MFLHSLCASVVECGGAGFGGVHTVHGLILHVG